MIVSARSPRLLARLLTVDTTLDERAALNVDGIDEPAEHKVIVDVDDAQNGEHVLGRLAVRVIESLV